MEAPKRCGGLSAGSLDAVLVTLNHSTVTPPSSGWTAELVGAARGPGIVRRAPGRETGTVGRIAEGPIDAGPEGASWIPPGFADPRGEGADSILAIPERSGD